MDFLGGLLQIIVKVLFQWYGWVGIVAIMYYFIWQNKRKATNATKTEHSLLLIDAPHGNESNAEQMSEFIAALQSTLVDKAKLRAQGKIQHQFSLEIANSGEGTKFYIRVPRELLGTVQAKFVATFPHLRLHEVADYTDVKDQHSTVRAAELVQEHSELLPIKTYQFIEHDQLQDIYSLLQQNSADESLWIQIIVQPVDNAWHKNAYNEQGVIRQQIEKRVPGAPEYLGQALIGVAAKKSDQQHSKVQQKAMEQKASESGFRALIRLVYLGSDDARAHLRMQEIISLFERYDDIEKNGFRPRVLRSEVGEVRKYKARYFFGAGNLLNISEVTSLWHIPTLDPTAGSAPLQAAGQSNQTAIPLHLPTSDNTPSESLRMFGATQVGNEIVQFGMARHDHRSHILVFGDDDEKVQQLSKLLMINDIYQKQRVLCIDTQNLAPTIAGSVRPADIDETAFIDTSDHTYSFSLNSFESIGGDSKLLAAALTEVFAPHLSTQNTDLLQNCIQTLIEYPLGDPSDLSDLLLDTQMRESLLTQIDNIDLLAFWGAYKSDHEARVLASEFASIISQHQLKNTLTQADSQGSLLDFIDENRMTILQLPKTILGAGFSNILALNYLAQVVHGSPVLEQPLYVYINQIEATELYWEQILASAAQKGIYLLINTIVLQKPLLEQGSGLFVFNTSNTEVPQYLDNLFDTNFLQKQTAAQFVARFTIENQPSHPFAAALLQSPPVDHELANLVKKESQLKYGVHRDIVKRHSGIHN